MFIDVANLSSRRSLTVHRVLLERERPCLRIHSLAQSPYHQPSHLVAQSHCSQEGFLRSHLESTGNEHLLALVDKSQTVITVQAVASNHPNGQREILFNFQETRNINDSDCHPSSIKFYCLPYL
jgi:hypothetical protein